MYRLGVLRVLTGESSFSSAFFRKVLLEFAKRAQSLINVNRLAAATRALGSLGALQVDSAVQMETSAAVTSIMLNAAVNPVSNTEHLHINSSDRSVSTSQLDLQQLRIDCLNTLPASAARDQVDEWTTQRQLHAIRSHAERLLSYTELGVRQQLIGKHPKARTPDDLIT